MLCIMSSGTRGSSLWTDLCRSNARRFPFPVDSPNDGDPTTDEVVLRVGAFLSVARSVVIAAAAVAALGTVSAEARPRHHGIRHAKPAVEVVAEPCFLFCTQPPEANRPSKLKGRARMQRPEPTWPVSSQGSSEEASKRSKDTVVGGRPAGCPKQWCGCQASIELFSRILPALNRAAAWLAFPHVAQSAAEPDMAAVRGRNHVVVLKQHVSGGRWVVKDGNWGGKAHIREIDLTSGGYTVVDPRGGGRIAMN